MIPFLASDIPTRMASPFPLLLSRHTRMFRERANSPVPSSECPSTRRTSSEYFRHLSIISLTFSTSFFAGIITVILSISVVQDAQEMGENFGVKESLYVYESDGEYFTGIFGAFGAEDETEYIDKGLINSLNDNLNNVKDDYYKVTLTTQ